MNQTEFEQKVTHWIEANLPKVTVHQQSAIEAYKGSSEWLIAVETLAELLMASKEEFTLQDADLAELEEILTYLNYEPSRIEGIVASLRHRVK